MDIVECNQDTESCSKSLVAYILCIHKGQSIATCYFYRDAFQLPQSFYDGEQFRLMFHQDVYAEFCNKMQQLPNPSFSDLVTFAPSHEPGFTPVHSYPLPRHNQLRFLSH